MKPSRWKTLLKEKQNGRFSTPFIKSSFLKSVQISVVDSLPNRPALSTEIVFAESGVYPSMNLWSILVLPAGSGCS